MNYVQLNPVAAAAYNSCARSTGTTPCLPGTQVAVLQEINKWIESNSGQSLFWLYGPAGSGKSTIAYTIAQQWSGASFFFSRGQLYLRETQFFFQTIAFQLGSDRPSLREEISNTLKDSNILTTDRGTQLQKLILEPISRAKSSPSKLLVIVIDALDECDEEAAVTEIIKLLTTTLNAYDTSVRLRFLVTSRPEPYLLELFEKLQVASFDLSRIDTTQDLCRFVTHELRKLADRHPALKKARWPQKRDIQFLTGISNGVFTAACIAINFIASDENSPLSQLQKLREAGQLSGLDMVYKAVLSVAISEKLPAIIGTLILAFTPLSMRALAGLLRMEVEDLTPVLRALHAVIHIQEGEETLIYPLHASFYDFLTDPNRCTDPRLFIQTTQHHCVLACACLERMMSLLQQPNILGIWKPTNDKHGNAVKLLPGDLTYACCYWARHVALSKFDQSLVALLHKFASDHVLYWIESLILIGELDLGITGISSATEMLSSIAHDIPELVNLLSDVHHFLVHFRDILPLSPLYTYSALQLTPAKTRLHQQYAQKFENMALSSTLKWDAAPAIMVTD